MQEQPQHHSPLLRFLASVVVIVVAVLIFLYRDLIIDQFSVWQYKPSAQIASLADKGMFTDTARFYFYASQPALEDRNEFSDNCTQRGEKTVVLGCYVSRRIHVFNVTDSRLEGIREVTAAHEMLHAVYDRHNSAERSRIDGLIEKQYASITDERIRNLVSVYDKAEPGERMNELHSILGTEVESLLPELEDYYRKYFDDRNAVVKLSNQYEQVFTNLKNQQGTLSNELKELSASISEQITGYNTAINQLNTDIAAFNAKAKNGGFASQSQFNAERLRLVAQQTALNTQRDQVNAAIASYNQKRSDLEALNGQAESLNNSINSLEPVPSL